MMEYLGSNLANAVLVMVIGMVVVFIGLIVLIGCTTLMSKLLKRDKPEKPAPKAQTAPVAVAPVASAPAAAEGLDPQVVAVISAAIMAMEQGGKRLVVRAVRRAGGQSGWASAGRSEQINY